MNDLNQLLHDAADSGGGHRLDPQDLLSSGRRKVRNRRLALAGGAVTAAVAAAALVAGLQADDDRPDVVDDPDRRSATYEEVRVPVEEVERRCSVVLNAVNRTDDLEYVAGRSASGRGVSGTEVDHFIETREGWVAYLVPAGERWNFGEPAYPDPETGVIGPSASDGGSQLDNACVIPQPGLIDSIDEGLEAPVPPMTDPAAVADLCSARSGYDVGTWDPLVAGVLDGDTVAILMSSNGFVAHCALGSDGFTTFEIEADPYLDDDGVPIPPGPRDLRLDPSFMERYRGTATYGAARVLPGLPDGYTVNFSANGDVLAETTTHRGAYLVEFTAPAGVPVTGRLTDPEGAVVWEGIVRAVAGVGSTGGSGGGGL